MPRERLPMRKIHDVLRLHAGGLSKRRIAVGLNTGRTAVGDYLRRARRAGLAWPLPEGLSDEALERLLFAPPPAVSPDHRPLPDWPLMHRELKRLRHPDADQVARDVVAPGQPVKGLASEIFLSNLSLELNAVGSVLGHGFHPLTLTPKSGPGGSSPMRPERWSCPSWPVPASGSRCSSGAVVGYRRSRCTRIAQPWPRAG